MAVPITLSRYGPLGAGSVAVRPSWLTAVPCTTPHILSLAAKAFDSGFSTTAPHPSPRKYPSASFDNVAHWPFLDSIPDAHKLMNTWKLKSRFTPTATATSQSCAYMALQAASVATTTNEHAVSIVIEGPTNPNTYANRFAVIDEAAQSLHMGSHEHLESRWM